MVAYLITGATGDVGARVVEQLIRRGERPRIFVRDIGKARSRFGDRVDISVGDLGSKESLAEALDGIDEFFLVNSGPQIRVRDELAAAVAKAAGVRHLVKLSSMDVQQGLAIGAWHERGEAAIRASGILFTFVQPTGFMSNLLAWAPSIKAEGIVRASTGEGRRAFIHSDDIAAVAVMALTTREYDGQSLPITGPESLSFAEVTAKIGAAIGKSLTFQPISDEEARERYSRISGSAEETEAHVDLWHAIRDGRLATVTHNVQRILGRKPIAIDQWLLENAEAFRQTRITPTMTLITNKDITVPVTVQTRTALPPDRAFQPGVDLSLVFKGWGPFPAVRGIRNQTGAWDHAGASRNPILSDGSVATEKLTEYTPGHSFAYEVTGFTNIVLRRLVDGVRGEWTFTPDGSGTVIRWTYEFKPLRRRYWLVRHLLAPLWRHYMQAGVEAAARVAEDR